ncbi:MAG: cob(I)yrinic acid a,c-diamide adenosyltransferase [Sphingobacteriia bacterium]|jgi:cob(I)alamin adenosyltransferase|nr:cob(I)yrinic acid a,c-diamide adenosyltransferase [Paludibacteraceae bacterium]NCA79211.1 cob(I)yrinic acid a,c-diamide adenosyltransferase [Sphingobacteriia bacterium]
MKIYTKSGDKGQTSLIGGTRVCKNDARIKAYGTVDELNSFLGLLRSKLEHNNKQLILEIQNTLFVVGANLATDISKTPIGDFAKISDEKIRFLEENIDKIDAQLPQIDNFIIYGEDELSALCHICRAIARRAEIEILSVDNEIIIDKNVLAYMNRLSDFLFVFARFLGKKRGNTDFFWQK